MFFWVWFDLWRLPRETVSKSCSLLEVILLLTINLSSLLGSVWDDNCSGCPLNLRCDQSLPLNSRLLHRGSRSLLVPSQYWYHASHHILNVIFLVAFLFQYGDSPISNCRMFSFVALSSNLFYALCMPETKELSLLGIKQIFTKATIDIMEDTIYISYRRGSTFWYKRPKFCW